MDGKREFQKLHERIARLEKLFLAEVDQPPANLMPDPEMLGEAAPAPVVTAIAAPSDNTVQ